MGTFGLKISEEGKNVQTSGLSDTSFNSGYASLMLLEKKTMTWSATSASSSGTETYSHNLGYPPLILGFLTFSTQSENYPSINYEFNLPYSASVATRGGTDLEVIVDIVSKENSVDLEWGAAEYVAGTPVALTDDVDFTAVLHIYSYKLGYET